MSNLFKLVKTNLIINYELNEKVMNLKFFYSKPIKSNNNFFY